MPNLKVRRLDTREIVAIVGVSPWHRVEVIMRHMLRNIDTEQYFIDDSEFDEPAEG